MEKYIVLDIDRTIINGTSWYYACTCPDLLMNELGVEKFKQINEELFVNGTDLTKAEFKRKTFELMNKKISERCIDMLKKEGEGNNLIAGAFLCNEVLRCAGAYTIKKLISVDEYCLKIIAFIYKYYTGNIKIIFLTSGYYSFMQGLLQNYMQNFEVDIFWDIIGTEITFYNGKVQFGNIITQQRKYEIVKNMLHEGKKIVFLADDSYEEPRLFDIVSNNGGYAFNVKYSCHSLNWKNLYNKVMDKNIMLKFLMTKSSVQISGNYIKRETPFDIYCDEIGILNMNQEDFLRFCDSIANERIVSHIRRLVYQKKEENKIYFRGDIYYFWLPPFINMSFKMKYESWKELYLDGYQLFTDVINCQNMLKSHSDLLVYVACDHLLAALYLALYCMEEQSLKGKYVDVSNYVAIQDTVQAINTIMYFLFEGIEYSYMSHKVYSMLSEINLSQLCIIEESDKFLLELDNYIIIYKTIKKVLKDLGEKIHKIDAVVYFAYGGIALGSAIHAVISIMRNEKVNIYTSHFSSKRFANKEEFLCQIPKIRPQIGLENNEMILLIDNNATTFKTLKDTKDFLNKRGIKAYCAVAEIDYDNICKWLYDNQKFEDMCHEWYEVLDFLPTGKYISAYNTWGTSTKSNILQSRYSRERRSCKYINKKRNIYCKHRKICRVHNMYDLQVALAMGATMVGIHAVISEKEQYYKTEKIGEPLVEYSTLPVPDYEVEGIKHMVKNMPSTVKPILVIERELSKEQLDRILEIYGLGKKHCGIQIQFITDSLYVKMLNDMGFSHIIISVGIVQKNAQAYLEKIEKSLRSDKDFILLDMSKHQPQLLFMKSAITEYSLELETKMEKLQNYSRILKKTKIPVLLADDLEPEEFILCQLLLKSKGVNVVGLDMQNNIEINKEEQGYCKVRDENSCYYIKIRKSMDKTRKWKLYDAYLKE